MILHVKQLKREKLILFLFFLHLEIFHNSKENKKREIKKNFFK